jgi:uncharacterized membrane-anchored protein
MWMSFGRNVLFPWITLVLLVGLVSASGASKEEERDGDLGFDWHKGPYSASMRNVAQMKIPEGYRFLDHKDAKRWLERSGSTPDGNELGIVQNLKDEWVIIFEFDDIGYVKDDEKTQLESMADDLLKSYREGAEQQNERREKLGMPPLSVLGWQVKPSYHEETKNLEWCILGESGGHKFVNHNVRLLGRRGVTKVTLIEDQEKIDQTLPIFRTLMKEYSYSSGEGYAEYKQGDKIAKVGLGALVLGGAAAAAYKVGLLGWLLAFFKKGFKFIILALVAVGAAAKNILSKLFGGRKDPQA